MRVLGWLLAMVYLGTVVVFALNNAMMVPLKFTSTLHFGEVPLVFVIIASFVLGILLGLAALAPRLLVLRRQLARLSRPELQPIESADDRLAIAARNAGRVGAFEPDRTYTPR